MWVSMNLSGIPNFEFPSALMVIYFVAEGAGFEPAVPLVGVHTISNRAPSARLGHPSVQRANIV